MVKVSEKGRMGYIRGMRGIGGMRGIRKEMLMPFPSKGTSTHVGVRLKVIFSLD